MKRNGIQASTDRARREARLTLDVVVSRGNVSGTVSAEGRDAEEFEGWLGLAQVVAGAVSGRSAGSRIDGRELLGEGPRSR